MTRTPTLAATAREFWRHASPWLLLGGLIMAISIRIAVGQWRWSDLLAAAALLVISPVIEWLIHVHVLHARPRRLGPIRLDSMLARKHREHHADPRSIELVFIPWQVELWLFPAITALCLLAIPATGLGLGFGASVLAFVAAFGCVYEWTHYLLHSDYRPRSRAYRAIWRHHRLHHYKNENYWLTVTTAATADRLFGTAPDPSTVETSPTVRRLHDLDTARHRAEAPPATISR